MESTITKNSFLTNLKKSWYRKGGLREHTFFFVLMLPSLLLLGGIILWPFLNVFRLSLFDKHLLREAMNFVAFDNFIKVFESAEFWRAFRITLVWTFGVTGLAAIIGLFISLLLHQKLPFRSLARGLILFPYVVPTVVAALVFRYLFNDLYGIVNQVLVSLGGAPFAWLSSTDSAIIALILVGTWKFFPFYVIALLARLQIIPEELYEAAQIDGANAFQSLRFITMPSIMPVFLLTILLRIIWTFNKFDIIYLLTGGGPARSTTTLPILVYNKVFVEYRVGVASAMAVLMFAFLAIVGGVYAFLNERLEQVHD
jgi:multiple sugar transport system permease protein